MNDDAPFFDSWDSLLRTVVTTVLAYVGLIVLLRVSGKRTLSKMNAFDLVVTVALGSTLATVALNKSVPLADGLLAFLLLIFLQLALTWLSVRYAFVSKLIKATLTLLVYDGKMLDQAMRQERVHPDEIYAVVRENGLSALDQAYAVVLETDGSLTVIKRPAAPGDDALQTVAGPHSV